MKSVFRVFALIVGVCCLGQLQAQTLLPVNNKTIEYNIWRTSLECSDSNIVILRKNLVLVHISDTKEAILKKLSKKQWLTLLNDRNYDWAANLLLYDFYERDAVTYRSIVKSRQAWISSRKAKEIQYWTSFLKD